MEGQINLSVSTDSWMPLLTGPGAAKAQAAVDAIALELPQRHVQPALAGGDAGAALFYGYLARHQPGRSWEGRAAAHLDQAVAALGEEVLSPGLFGGFTGIAWAMEHLQGHVLETDGEDPNEEIDAALEGFLHLEPWTRDYDLISGLVGFGVYGLERIGKPSGKRILSRVVELLDATKAELEGGVTWHTSPRLLPAWQRELNPLGYYNLGVAHGVPAVIALLGQACAFGIERPRSQALLEGAMAWLLGQRYPGGCGSSFGTTVSPGHSSQVVPSRLAWCYGDLGLSVALLGAARAVARADWEGEALDIACAAARRPRSESGVRDAGLCHGAAGNAHLFNRLWQATQEELFREAALAWFGEALSLRIPGKGIGGFRNWAPDPDAGEAQDPWRESPGLLEGAAGIGLALMAGIYPEQPRWDRILLASNPGTPIGV